MNPSGECRTVRTSVDSRTLAEMILCCSTVEHTIAEKHCCRNVLFHRSGSTERALEQAEDHTSGWKPETETLNSSSTNIKSVCQTIQFLVIVC
jgi:hypothetical protein